VILFASDHAGLILKRHLISYLEEQGRTCRDLGTDDGSSVDYPEFAHRLAEEITGGRAEKGVLVCGSGIGMSMAANRHREVRAALCHDLYTAEMARRHNNANVLCLGGRLLGPDLAERMIDVFLATEFEGGRHQRRVAMIEPPTGSAT
jgi:ribose 5-phosphate isomerase B